MSATIRNLGAELISLKKENKEYMWSGDAAFWGKHSPVLFPIVGTLKDNTYLHAGKEYSLPRHGLARERNFAIISKEDSRVSFSLKADKVTHEVYPFDFELIISYEVTDTSLIVNYMVNNLSGFDKMQFSLGAHPAFALPGGIEGYSLNFPEDSELVRYKLENDLVSDKTETIALKDVDLPLNYDLFKDDALVMKKLSSKEIMIKEGGKPYLSVSYQNFPHMGLWTKNGAPFICIEPWQGYADTPSNNGNLSEKEGIVTLGPHETAFFRLDIKVQG